MAEKTPTSVLSEFCNLCKVTPLYNTVSQDSAVPIFTISVAALSYVAKGTGRTKADAKHDASQKLIDILAQLDRYKDQLNGSKSSKLKNGRSIPSEIFDAVGTLIRICGQRKISQPDFVVTSVTGEDHRKEFTIRCDVLPFHSIGMSTTKKEAKQIAATKMIKLVNSNDVASDSSSSSIQNADAVGALINLCRQCNFSLPYFDTVVIGGEEHRKEFKTTCTIDNFQLSGCGFQKKEAKQKAAMEMLAYLKGNADIDGTSSESESLSSCSDVPWILPIEELPSVEDVLAEYRRLKSQHHVPKVMTGIRYRKNFFMKLPKENRNQAIQILTHTYTGIVSPKEIVGAALCALGLQYKIDVKSENHIFSLINCKYDCVLIGQSFDIYDKVVQYLKVMLNVQNSLDVSHSDENIF